MNKKVKRDKYYMSLGLLCICFMMLGFVLPSVKAQGDFTYIENSDGTITISAYSGSSMQVVVPETIDGKTVTAIGKKAFYTQDITSVTLPSTVTTIGQQAFSYCAKLKSVSFADAGLLVVDKEAFNKCAELEAIVLPATVQNINEQAFAGVSSLSFETASVSAEYAKDVFKGSKISTLTCKQTSTTYKYASTIAKKINYLGIYSDQTSYQVKVAGTATISLKQETGETTWVSSKPAVATVENGVVTGVKAGKAVITATNNGDVLELSVTVANLKLNYSKVTVTKGYTKQLSLTNKTKAAWSSSNKKYVTVSQTGKVSAKAKGTATVTAQVGDNSYKCKVTVRDNKKTICKYATGAYGYSSGVMGFSTVTKTSKGYVVTGHFINGTYNRINYIKNMTITVKQGSKVIAKKHVGKIKLNQAGKTTKKLTFTFTGSNMKKAVDLCSSKTVSVSTSGGKYYWKTTKTVTKTVPVE